VNRHAGLLTASAFAALAVFGPLALGTAGPAQAEVPGCEHQFWMVGLRATTRVICDGPMQADGSWQRARGFYAPAYVTNSYSTCYNTGYFVNCTHTPPVEVAAFDQREVYTATAGTVPPDEPGYITGWVAPR
jgi:hypothetical protein